jgi:hypothetical protein
VTFLEKELRPVSSAQDLGMEFDKYLSYDEHITQLHGLKMYKVSLPD